MFNDLISNLYHAVINCDYEDLTDEKLNIINDYITDLAGYDANDDIRGYIDNITNFDCLCLTGCGDNTCVDCYSDLVSAIDELYYIEDEIVTCERCGYLSHIDNCEEYRGDFYCPDCEIPAPRLMDYHSYTVKNNSNTFNTIGLELETEYAFNIDTAQVIEEINTSFIGSYDGSLSNGIEFVSNVYAIDNKEELYSDIHQLIHQIKEYNCKCHKSVNSGLHIHVNRHCFNVPIKKLFDFVYNNKIFFMSISGRIANTESFRYCKPINNYQDDERVDTRYGLLNINNKYNTIEFRLFNSTLNEGTLIKRIEFILLLIEFLNSEKPLYLIDLLNFIRIKDFELFEWIFYWWNKRASDIREIIKDF